MSQSAHSVEAVVFDLDGLMFNTEDIYLQVGSEVLRRRNKRRRLVVVHARNAPIPAKT